MAKVIVNYDPSGEGAIGFVSEVKIEISGREDALDLEPEVMMIVANLVDSFEDMEVLGVGLRESELLGMAVHDD